MHQFNEHHAEFKGFSAFYDKEILPSLELGESSRQTAVKKVLTWVPLTVLATCFLIVAALYYEINSDLTFFIGAMGLGLAFTLVFVLTAAVRRQTKTDIVGGICRFLGLDFSEELNTPPQTDMFTSLGLLTRKYDRASFEDRMAGAAHGAAFEFYEAHLEKRRRTKNGNQWTTKFRGQLLVIDFDRQFLGRTVVLRDKGIFNRKAKGDMKRVGLVDPVFEKIFEAYGTDQVEARYLLPPDFMQRLVDLEQSVDGKNIRFGFVDKQLLIAVETANRYEAGSMFKPLVQAERTQKILDEIGAIYDVIDGVMKPLSRG